jgi:hypothetical protein
VQGHDGIDTPGVSACPGFYGFSQAGTRRPEIEEFDACWKKDLSDVLPAKAESSKATLIASTHGK